MTTPELPDDADDDEALRYAIALSLQDQASTTPVVIDDSDDDDGNDNGNDDDGSSTASASSVNSTQQTAQQTTQQTTQTQTQPQAPSQPLSSSQQSQFGALFLDRKAMEQERLNRLAKRQRPATDDDNDEDEDVVEVPPPKKQAIRAPAERHISASSSTLALATRIGQDSSSNNSNSNKNSVPYPNPTVKRTWTRGTARTGDEITIEQVFQKDKLELAVLSSFQWDEEWMLSKLDYTRTKILLLAYARDEAQVLKFIHISTHLSSISFLFFSNSERWDIQ